jgi:hypothetical protein
MPIKAGLERAGYVLGEAPRGEGNEQHIARERAIPESACEFKAGHVGHGNVGYNGERQPLLGERVCRTSVAHAAGFEPVLLQ